MNIVKDIRWKQRFENYNKALVNLQLVDQEYQLNTKSIVFRMALIKSFEVLFELAWKTMKDYLQDQGITDITGSRGAIREAFKQGIIVNGQTWMDMLDDRNTTSHVYDVDAADAVLHDIVNLFLPEFYYLQTKFQGFI